MKTTAFFMIILCVVQGFLFAQEPSNQDAETLRVLEEARARYHNSVEPTVPEEVAVPQPATTVVLVPIEDKPTTPIPSVQTDPPIIFALEFLDGLPLSYQTSNVVLGLGVISSRVGTVNGLQTASVSTHADTVRGLQVSGVMASGGTIHGLQTAGVFTQASVIEGAQIAGVFSEAGSVKGAQISGVFNQAGDVNGSQIAGIINIAKDVQGAQIGLINISETIKGPSIGLITISKNGILAIKGGRDSHENAELGFQSGSESLYTHLYVSFPWEKISDPSTIELEELVIGTALGFRLGEPKWHLDLEAGIRSLPSLGIFDEDTYELTGFGIAGELRATLGMKVIGNTGIWASYAGIFGTPFELPRLMGLKEGSTVNIHEPTGAALETRWIIGISL